MRKSILLLLLIFVTSSYGQDLLSRKAPVDRIMKSVDTKIMHKVDEDEKEPVVKTPILVDNSDGWGYLADRMENP